MRLACAACATLLLSGCVANYYVPQTIGDPVDLARFTSDQRLCIAGAMGWRPQVSLGDVAQGVLTGGTGSLAYLPINPAIPALGAAGGAIDEASKGFDWSGSRRQNVYRHCLQDMVQIDHSAIIANPEK